VRELLADPLSWSSRFKKSNLKYKQRLNGHGEAGKNTLMPRPVPVKVSRPFVIVQPAPKINRPKAGSRLSGGIYFFSNHDYTKINIRQSVIKTFQKYS
jgi:hypothetical protein